MDWLQTIVNGLMLGGLYGLFGLGLALVFGVMRVVNLAHGEFIVLAAYGGTTLAALVPGVSPLWWVLPVAVAAFGVGYALQALLVNRAVRSGDPLTPLMLTFGLAVVLRNLMVEVFGTNPQALDGGAFTRAGFDVLGLRIALFPLAVLALAAAMFFALQWLLSRTEWGRIVRATSDNFRIVRLMGVEPNRVYNTVMGLALAFAAVAGMLLALRTSFTPYSGAERLLVAFEVVILGGLGSFWGAFAGGMALGVAQLLGQKFDSNAGSLYSHLLFFVVLILWPTGLSRRGR